VVIHPKHGGGRLTPVPLPYPLSCWRSRCCATSLWEISSAYVDDDSKRSPPHLCLYLVLYLEEKGGNKNGTLLVREPASLYSNSNIFGFFSGARCKN
jgi:hypothetical protein